MKKVLIVLMSFAVFSCTTAEIEPDYTEKITGSYKMLRFELEGFNILTSNVFGQVLVEKTNKKNEVLSKIIVTAGGQSEKLESISNIKFLNNSYELYEGNDLFATIKGNDLKIEFVDDEGDKIYILARKQ